MQTPKFKFYFHPSEKYFPSSFNYFVENSQLIIDNKNYGTIPQTDLPNISCPSNLDTYLKASDDIKEGIKSLDFSKIPIYYFDRTYGEFNYRTFLLFYPYNGDYNLILTKVGAHWGDIERFTIEYNKSGDTTRIYFGAHGDKDGRWVEFDQVEKEDDHIILYVAKEGHGFYPKSGMYFRYFGLANDITSRGGKTFIPQVFLNIPSYQETADLSKVGLAYFCGKIGEDGIDSLVNKGWFYNPEVSVNPPPLINSRLYYITLTLISVGILTILFMGGRFGYRKTSNSRLFILIYIFIIISILLYIRHRLQLI